MKKDLDNNPQDKQDFRNNRPLTQSKLNSIPEDLQEGDELLAEQLSLKNSRHAGQEEVPDVSNNQEDLEQSDLKKASNKL